MMALIDVHDGTVLWTPNCPVPELIQSNLVRVQKRDGSFQVQKRNNYIFHVLIYIHFENVFRKKYVKMVVVMVNGSQLAKMKKSIPDMPLP